MSQFRIDPFFILGAPRSGTTMLRDIFRQIEELYSPEETHFFRWGAPFRGNEFTQFYKNNKILRLHREMDGIDDEEFYRLWDKSHTKREFTEIYCNEVARKKGKTTWFEKTPQNVYGLPLIIRQFPEAKIVHLVRHPYCVIKSLIEGKVMNSHDVVGAANYWYESVSIIDTLRPLMESRLAEIHYEALQKDPDAVFDKIRSQILGGYTGEIDLSHVDRKVRDSKPFFSADQIDIIQKICGELAEQYGYAL